MRAIVQEHKYGCGVVCVAFVLGIKYKEAVLLFENGDYRVKMVPNFYCREMVSVLNSNTAREYVYKYLKKRLRSKIYRQSTIVYIKKSKKYKYGHYLVRFGNKWMDPWINLPNRNRKAGFRKRLPGKPTYLISTVD